MYLATPPADLILHLRVPLDVAVERNLTRDKPGGPEPLTYLRRRHRQSSEPNWDGVVSTQLINSDACVEETLRSVKVCLWNAL